MSNLLELDLVGIADAIRDGDISAEKVAEFCLDRLTRYGFAFNAVARVDAEEALHAARAADLARASGKKLGPLHGVALAHKDLFDRGGRTSLAGSKIRADYVASETASVLQRLDLAGAIDLGTLQMAEMALSPSGYNAHYGHGLNPWAPTHVSGGSSSGSGIAVAGRMVFGSLGTDTGGSIRQPAAMCGVTGLKPTLRRVSGAGVLPLSWSLDCIGPLAQSARDCARLLSVIAGADPRDGSAAEVPVPDYEAALNGSIRGLRIAVPRGYYDETLEPQVAAARNESLQVLRDLGAHVVETHSPDMDTIGAMMQVVMACESATIHRRWLAERPQDYSDQVRGRLEAGLYYPATRYIEALSLRAHFAQEYLDKALGNCDLIHLPAISIGVPTITATTGSEEQVATSIRALTRCMGAINYLGFPSLCVPVGFSDDGLPIGVQLVGKPFDESLLLRTGDAFQRVTDWHRRVPDCDRSIALK